MDISEGIDINKTSKLKKWNICHYWHFQIKGLMMLVNLSNIFILNIKDNDVAILLLEFIKVRQ